MRLTFVIFGAIRFTSLTNASPFIFCPYYSTILEIPNKHFDSYKSVSFSFKSDKSHSCVKRSTYSVHGTEKDG